MEISGENISDDKESTCQQIYDYDKYKSQSKNKSKYHNVIITLSALLLMPIYLYGITVIYLVAVGLATAFLVDFICIKIISRKHYVRYDCSSYITALITVMLMPATVPYWVIIFSIVISLCVAKYPFGGTSHNIFNPAAVGVAFSALCWPEFVLRYPVPYSTYSGAVTQYASSPASILRVGGTPKIDFFDVLLGRYPGALGVTCMLVLAACMLYLISRKVISKRVVFSSIFIICIFAFFFPRVLTGEKSSIIYELSSGAFIFGIIFMANDPYTMPITKSGRIFYGTLIGLFVVMFRYFGQIELEFVYAILLANVFASACDRYALRVKNKTKNLHKKKARERLKAGGNDA